MKENVTLERHGPIARVGLNRPEKLNAIDTNMCIQLEVIFDRLEAEDDIRVVVLSGSGSRAFSAGADLTHMRSLEGAVLSRFIEKTWTCFERISQSHLLTIAALQGHVLGGGLELALACDFRLADATVQIALPEMTLGSVPGSGAMQRLPALVGTSKALELAVFGRRVGAQEALRLGLINGVSDKESVSELAMEWAEQVCQRPADALRYAKAAMRIRGDPVLAANFHGLVSMSCHRNKQYQQQTGRYKK